MTFYELIQSSLLLDSSENRPPGMLAQAVLDAFDHKCGSQGLKIRNESQKASDHNKSD